MSLYNYFLTNPFGPGARTIEWIYLGRTGGSILDLDGEPTYGADDSGTNIRIVALDNQTAEIWQLIASNHPHDPTNGWVRPLDFGISLNEKVWKRLACFGVGGGGGGSGDVWTVGETPSGLINGTNQDFTTASDFTKIGVWLNGVRQRGGVDYTVLSSNTIHFISPPFVGDSLLVDYTTTVVGEVWTIGEIPTGLINGTNQDFTTASNFTKLEVYLNGLRMRAGSDYNVSGANTFHFLYPPYTGDTLLVDYTT